MISSFSKYSVFFFLGNWHVTPEKNIHCVELRERRCNERERGWKNKLVILYGILLPEAVCILNVKSYVICYIKKKLQNFRNCHVQQYC